MENDRLSILMFDAAFPFPIIGGKEKQAYLLSKELKEQGVNIFALSYKHNDNKSEVVSMINIKRIERGIFSVPSLILFLFKMRFNYKILHIHTPSRIGLVMVILGKMFSYKVVFKFPGEALLKENKNFFWKFIVKKSDMFVVLEERTYSKLLEYSFIKKRIFMIENGVEIKEKRKIIEKDIIELIFLGRLHPIKRCDDLLRACKKLDNDFKNWHLTIVGDGELFEELLNLSVELGISEKVTFAGYQNNPSEWLEKSDIFLITSDSEGMSNSMLEAMAIGIPIITTRVSSVETMLGKDYEYTINARDVDSLSKKIFELATNFEKRKFLSSYIYTRCIDNFSIESVAKKYIERYKKL